MKLHRSRPGALPVVRSRSVAALPALTLAVVALLARPSLAQPEPPYRSPVVDGDRVTLRIAAPGAERVTVDGPLGRAVESVATSDEGLWTFTTRALDPDIYEYAFSVDGVRTLDSQNPWLKYWRTSSNLVAVEGDPPAAWAERDVPHGTVHVVRYTSKSLGGVPRRAHVYTPPGYDPRGDREYPVLYLLHGFGDDDAAWSSLGRANFTLDNAIADGRAVPMLVVMPYGHARFAEGAGPAAAAGDDRSSNLRAVTTDVLEDVVPLVESRFRARRDPGARAVVGLSMGGGQALWLGLHRPGTFAWVGAFSSAVPGRDADDDSGFALAFPEIDRSPDEVAGQLRWLWIGCGKDDFLFDADRRFSAWLTSKSVPHDFVATEGGHSWTVWRGDYLPRVVPLLFRDGSRLRAERLYDGLRTDEYMGEPRVLCTVEDPAGVFTEGPAVSRDGDLWFTNIPAAKILRWDVDEERLSVFRERSNATNGLLFDDAGRLLACEGGAGRVTRTDLASGEVEVLASEYDGFSLAPPNDLVLDRAGRLYFTSRPGETTDPSQGSVNAVYRRDPDGSLTRLLAWPRVHMPNGIVISPDGSTLYLIEAHPDADHHRDIRAFDLADDGSISNERVLFDFYPGRSGDGMCIDAAGNLWVAAGLHRTRGTSESLETRPGVHVISPAGELLAFRETPEDTVTNCTFGGADLRTLYVTCGSKVLAIPTKVPGAPGYRPSR